MITPETIQKIKDAAHIEEVIARFISLQKRGANYEACCPFHHEKSPSFKVNPVRNIYKCFGCGKVGDSINFVMEYDHRSYPETLRFLADMYNIDIEEEEVSDEQRARQAERDVLYHINHFALQFFNAQLLAPGSEGMAYLQGRGYTETTTKDYTLGFCPEADDLFVKEALANGYSEKVLLQSGLMTEEGHDRLAGCLVLPILSKDGKPISFVGRKLSNTPYRWVGLPASPLFDYSKTLFGFYQARNLISSNKENKCYLMSDFEQILSLHQSGIENVMAPCTLEVTHEQLRDIKRHTSNITLLCSPTRAGKIDASPFFTDGIHLRLVVFPQGETPDSMAQKQGSSYLKNFIEDNEQNFILYRIGLLSDSLLSNPESYQEMLRLLRLVTDQLERDAYIQYCIREYDLDEKKLSHDLKIQG